MEKSSYGRYACLKHDLLQCIDDMLSIEAIRECPCEELREKIRENAFNLVVVGQFKRGKTSLINALLGADILPVAVVPLTSIVTIMTWGEALRVKVYFNDDMVSEIKPESLSEYVTEKGNPKNAKVVREVSQARLELALELKSITTPLEALNQKLRAFEDKQIIMEHIRQAFNTWRALEDARLAKAFEAICGRYASKINDRVDALLKFSSDLFEIPFEAVKTELLWSDKSRFSYKFRDEPVGLQIVASTLTLALPKFIGDKIILNKMKEYLIKVIDMQAGRLGADFEERLKRANSISGGRCSRRSRPPSRASARPLKKA